VLQESNEEQYRIIIATMVKMFMLAIIASQHLSTFNTVLLGRDFAAAAIMRLAVTRAKEKYDIAHIAGITTNVLAVVALCVEPAVDTSLFFANGTTRRFLAVETIDLVTVSATSHTAQSTLFSAMVARKTTV
jgi:hypothetical protein